MTGENSARIDQPTIDPFSIEILQNSLQAVCDEMFTVLRRAAMSMLIYERLDFGVAVMDARGRMISQGAGLPAFIGILDSSVPAIVGKFGATGINDGDIFITNDPFGGGASHLNDIVLAMPVIVHGKLVGWAVNKAHWSDIGGMNPGSMAPNTQEIFQEGIVFPEIKLCDRGAVSEAIVDLIRANSRTPAMTVGDMWAGIAAVRAGSRRIVEIARRLGVDQFERAIDLFLADGERAARRAISRLPKGRYEAHDCMEDGRPLRALVTIADDAFIVDLRGNPAQDRSPFNCPFACTQSAIRIVYMSLVGEGVLANEGTFRPLQIFTDRGSVFHAASPNGVGYYFEPLLYAIDLVWKALAPVVPELLGAGQMNSVSAVIIGGTHRDTGQPALAIETQLGGWGARPGRDGESALYSAASGESFNSPVEIYERRNGVEVAGYYFHNEDGGEGEFRGGKGICKEFRVLADDAWLTTSHIKSRNPPWGLSGGRAGSGNFVKVLRVDGTVEEHRRATGLPLRKGDIVRVYTATGGGYGSPSARDRARLAADLKNGYITSRQAAEFYRRRDLAGSPPLTSAPATT